MQGKEPSQQGASAQVYIGIDVCKSRLDMHFHPLGKKLTVSNNAAGLKQFKKALASYDVALVVMEATGKLHRLAHRSLHDSGFRVAVVNPGRSRFFAKTIGVLAKTDAVDARVLAIMGENLSLPVLAPPSEVIENLQELVRGRDAAVAARTAVLNQIGESRTPLLITELKRQLHTLAKAIANLEIGIRRQIDADPELARRFTILTSIPGIGATTAIALIAGLNEIGSLSAKQAALLIGLAPIASDSGERNGHRHIQGGRAHLRTAVYMAAVSASRHNPSLKRFYDRLIAKGKAAKLALTAVMRKLVVLANTLVQQNRLWKPIQA